MPNLYNLIFPRHYYYLDILLYPAKKLKCKIRLAIPMTVKGNLIGKLEATIGSMGVGQQGYTVPWALIIEKKGRVYEIYLDTSFSVQSKSGGTKQLHVQRTGPGIEDYAVDLDTAGDHKFSLGKPTYQNFDEENLVKVGEVGMLEGLIVKED
jgi:hypothetical protein